jgi:hypothetical protein
MRKPFWVSPSKKTKEDVGVALTIGFSFDVENVFCFIYACFY